MSQCGVAPQFLLLSPLHATAAEEENESKFFQIFVSPVKKLEQPGFVFFQSSLFCSIPWHQVGQSEASGVTDAFQMRGITNKLNPGFVALATSLSLAVTEPVVGQGS